MPARVGVTVVWTPQPAVVAKSYFATAQQAQNLVFPMWEAINDVLIPEIDYNFAVEGRPSWEPLSEFTVLKRTFGPRGELSGKRHSVMSSIKQGTPEFGASQRTAMRTLVKMLRDRDLLYESVTSITSWDVSAEGASVVGMLVDTVGYGTYHLTGRSSPPMPVRDFTTITDEGLDEIEDIFANWVMEAF